MAKEGNLEMLERSRPTLNMDADAYSNDVVYNDTEIDTLLYHQSPRRPDDP